MEPTTQQERYECDHCGACCSGSLIVEVYDIDLEREPRLAEADRHRPEMEFRELMAELEQDGRCIVLGAGQPCPFYDSELNCSIYPTRPNVCVSMRAGDTQCQDVRREAGLGPLLPLGEPEQNE